jgi:hypothetical protein
MMPFARKSRCDNQVHVIIELNLRHRLILLVTIDLGSLLGTVGEDSEGVFLVLNLVIVGRRLSTTAGVTAVKAPAHEQSNAFMVIQKEEMA